LFESIERDQAVRGNLDKEWLSSSLCLSLPAAGRFKRKKII
jgi:hypothetical protein